MFVLFCIFVCIVFDVFIVNLFISYLVDFSISVIIFSKYISYNIKMFPPIKLLLGCSKTLGSCSTLSCDNLDDGLATTAGIGGGGKDHGLETAVGKAVDIEGIKDHGLETAVGKADGVETAVGKDADVEKAAEKEDNGLETTVGKAVEKEDCDELETAPGKEN